MATQTQNIAAAWRTRAAWLARWTTYHLLNRNDLWGRYVPEAKRVARPDGTMANARLAPVAARRGQVFLSEALLIRHYAGERPEDRLGIHSVSRERTSRWLVMDVHRGPQSTPEGNFKAAQAWYDRLVAARFLPVLTDSNGTGGYHLWVVFDQPLPSMRVAEFGRSLAADFNHFDLPVAPRTFPSVAAVRSGGQGNWVRLPGHHPLSDHWTRVWNGRHWLEGADAVEALLHAHGDSQRVLRDFEANLANTNVANTNVVNTDGVRRGAIGSSRVLVVPASQATTPSLSPAASQSAVSSQAFPPPSAPVPPLASASSASVLPNGTSPVPAVVDPRSEADRLQALRYLNAIQSGRARAYHEWLRVGMALHDVDHGEAMLLAWDDWSRSLPHYAPGLCAQHWRTFNGPGDRAAALGHLREWAEEDAAHSTPGNGAPLPADHAVFDAELREVIEGWPALSAHLRGVVVGMIRACRG